MTETTPDRTTHPRRNIGQVKHGQYRNGLNIAVWKDGRTIVRFGEHQWVFNENGVFDRYEPRSR